MEKRKMEYGEKEKGIFKISNPKYQLSNKSVKISVYPWLKN